MRGWRHSQGALALNSYPGLKPISAKIRGSLGIGFRPEGAIGLSLGFQPQEQVHTTTRPERAERCWGGRFVLHLRSPSQHRSTAPRGGVAFLNWYPGLKPWAESFCPFGAETECSMEPL